MDNNEFKNLIKNAYCAPKPVRKDEFISKLRPGKVSTFRMLLQQIPYIRPYVWIISAVIIGVYSNSNPSSSLYSTNPL